MNQVQLQKDLMISFRWTTKEKLDKMESKMIDGDGKK